MVVPYTHPGIGLFTIVAGGAVTKNGQSRMTFNFDAEPNLNLFMSKDQCGYLRQLNGRNNLAGETGLRLWFGNLIEGINQARIVKQSTGFIYSIEFITTLEGHIRPSFQTTYPSRKIFSGAFAANHSRKDDNTLTVTFAPYAKPVPFAATDLGKALAKIDADLAKAQEKRKGAKTELTAKNSALETAAKAPPGAAFPQPLSDLKASAEAAQAQFNKADEEVRSLESEREALSASAKAASKAAREAAAASTDNQLNNLICSMPSVIFRACSHQFPFLGILDASDAQRTFSWTVWLRRKVATSI